MCDPATTFDSSGSFPGLMFVSRVLVGRVRSARNALRVESQNALRRKKPVEAKHDQDAGERIEGARQSLLVHDRVDLDVREITDGPRFQGRHDRLGHLAALLAQLQVIDQAVLESRVRVFDRPRRVDAVDPPDEWHHNTHGCKHACNCHPGAEHESS